MPPARMTPAIQRHARSSLNRSDATTASATTRYSAYAFGLPNEPITRAATESENPKDVTIWLGRRYCTAAWATVIAAPDATAHDRIRRLPGLTHTAETAPASAKYAA